MIGGNSVVRWSTRISSHRAPQLVPPSARGEGNGGASRVPLLKLFDLDVAKHHAAGMRLQPDKTRRTVGFAAVRIGVDVIGLLLTVQENSEVIVLDANFKVVPLTRR